MHWPFIGWVLKHGGIFGVKRGKADVAAIKTAMKYLKDGELLLMFPEGTRHQDGEFGDAKTGAAMLALRTGVPIVPIYLPAEKKWFRWNPVVFGEAYYPKAPARSSITCATAWARPPASARSATSSPSGSTFEPPPRGRLFP